MSVRISKTDRWRYKTNEFLKAEFTIVFVFAAVISDVYAGHWPRSPVRPESEAG